MSEQLATNNLPQSESFDPLFPLLPPHLFAVISWGAAATRWLAKTLDSHPEIFATYHMHNSIGDVSLRGPQIMRTIARLSKTYILGGDVHGIARDEIPVLRHLLGNRFVSAVVVRDPIPRLKSQFALFEQYAGTRHWTGLDYLDPMLDRVGLKKEDATYKELLVLHGANSLNSIIEEQRVGRIFRSEDLTSNPDTLVDLVAELSRGAILASDEWVATAIALSPANVRIGADPRPLNDWHKQVIRAVVDPAAWELYEQLGYERPDFVRRIEI
jgi:hypothetical protein